jgi:hypothetical protein
MWQLAESRSVSFSKVNFFLEKVIGAMGFECALTNKVYYVVH